MIKIAIQKSGRLQENSLNLLKDCGIKLNSSHSSLKTTASNFPMEILFLRDDDIPQYVADGVADLGILGENVVFEKCKTVIVAEKLGFAKCRLSLAVPKECNYDGIHYFNNKKIATSYPLILGNYLKQHNIDAEIEVINGSVEIAPGIGLADGICDIVSSGSTLFTNGLKEVETVIKSEAVLVSSENLTEANHQLLKKLVFRIQAVKNAQSNKYILLNAPNENIEKIISILPGIKSPTILPLATKGWSSLHSVVKEDEFWEIIDKLKSLGAEGLLVVPIEKMVV